MKYQGLLPLVLVVMFALSHAAYSVENTDKPEVVKTQQSVGNEDCD